MSTYIKAYVPLIIAPFTGEAGKPQASSPGSNPSLFQRYGAWLKRRRTDRVLRALSPRMQRDIGYKPADQDPDSVPIFAALFNRDW